MLVRAATFTVVLALIAAINNPARAQQKSASSETRNAKQAKAEEKKEEESWIDSKKISGPSWSFTGRKKGGVYIWFEDDTWHVRYLIVSINKGHRCDGSIQIEGGRVYQVSGYQTMETKKGKYRDLGLVNKERTLIRFVFKAKGYSDGFDFKVSKSTKNLVFDLKEDGEDHTDRIYVGPDDLSPLKTHFVLPAHP